MKKPRSKRSLRRFTTIGSTLDLLRNKRVAFLDPEKWDDRNDAEFMRLFKRKAECNSLKALCCTESPETYHHWRVFTQSTDGCFIDFQKAPLLASIKENADYRASAMDYIRLDEIKISDYRIRDLPFLKRAGFKPEEEYRIIYTGPGEDDVHFMPIELAWINRIVLNPWLPATLTDSIVETFRDLAKKRRLRLRRPGSPTRKLGRGGAGASRVVAFGDTAVQGAVARPTTRSHFRHRKPKPPINLRSFYTGDFAQNSKPNISYLHYADYFGRDDRIPSSFSRRSGRLKRLSHGRLAVSVRATAGRHKRHGDA